MDRRTPSGRIEHRTRPVSTTAPMHLTTRVADGLPSLRDPGVKQLLKGLAPGTRERGLRLVAYSIMGNHLHLWVTVSSREALADGTRYFFGLLARQLNELWGRRGPVWEERFYSVVAWTPRQSWFQLAYILRNPVKDRCRRPDGGFDPYQGADERAFGEHPWLATVFGWPGRALRRLLRRFANGVVPYQVIPLDPQPGLPGLQ